MSLFSGAKKRENLVLFGEKFRPKIPYSLLFGIKQYKACFVSAGFSKRTLLASLFMYV
jgi:hypothetical protein